MKKSKPHWLRVRIPSGKEFGRVRELRQTKRLHTVCEEAACPNLAECWGDGTATFLILGSICTRNCGFCNIRSGDPGPVDRGEPGRVAEAVAAMGLEHAVITSVTRDDLPDGGAELFGATIREIRRAVVEAGIEVLIPDFQGSRAALRAVIEAEPDILNHNVETVPGLYARVRPQARFKRSLELLRRAKEISPQLYTKSGLMVGLGEKRAEVLLVMQKLREAGCDVLTIGQYLQPSRAHVRVERYYEPGEFEELKALGEELGFKEVESGPLVRSSYHARFQARALRRPK